MTLEQHPLCKIFPQLSEIEFKALATDLKKNGLRHKITLFQNQILDGWHRYKACQEVAITPKFETYRGDDPVALVLSENRFRRQLTGSQIGWVVVKARECKWQSVGKPANSAPGAELATSAEMAATARVSKRTIEQEKKVIKDGTPKLNDAVKEGAVSVKVASALADLPPGEQNERLEAVLKGEKVSRGSGKPFDPEKCSHRAECPLPRAYDELREKFADLVDVAKTQEDVMKSDVAVEVLKLRGEIRRITERRNALMAQAREMRTTINYWKGQAKKLGWKEPKRKAA